MVRWANKGSESKKEEKAARVIIDVNQFTDGSFEKDLLLAALSA